MRITALLMMSGLCVFAMGCARVSVQAPKEPIKVDISMRLDVYQHIEKDIDDIENIVTGSAPKPQSKVRGGVLDFLVSPAHADEGLSPEVEQAAFRRRDRLSGLSSFQKQGVVGENQSGFVEARDAGQGDAAVEALVRDENDDRVLIYRAVAAKNGSSVEEVQKLYAQRLQNSAPSGTPIEVRDEAAGSSSWRVKP